MKKKIALLFFFVSIIGFSQEKESILDKAAKETCEYLTKEKFEGLSKAQVNMKLGLFMFKVYNKYVKEFNNEGITFDLSKGEDEARKFGEKLGVSMIKFCPEGLIAISKIDDKKEDKVEEEVEPTYFVTGELVKISGKDYSVVYLKNKNDETLKFVWLSNFTGSNKLIYTKKVKGLKVKLQYRNLEWYAPKLKEYITKKEIIGIEYLDE